MGCAASSQKQPKDVMPDVNAMAEEYFEHHRSLRARERASLNRVMLNSRVEHDNSSGSGAPSGRSRAASESGLSATELDSQSVARSQADALERYNRSVSGSRRSASSVGGLSRSSSLRSPEETAARREARQQARLQKEEEELALALAVSASEAEAVAAVMAETIAPEDAKAIAAAAAELNSAEQSTERDVAATMPSRYERGAPVRHSLSASGSFCETIREAAEEEVVAAVVPAEPLPLREKYTTTVAVPPQYTEAERHAYHRILAEVDRQRAGNGRSHSATSRSAVSVGDSAASVHSTFARRSAPRNGLEHIAEHAVEKAAAPRRDSSLSKQRRQQEKQEQEARAWRQNSLDSAFDVHGKQLVPPPPPRGFMVA